MKKLTFIIIFSVITTVNMIMAQQWSAITNTNIWNLNTGNVGIGTNTPNATLQVFGKQMIGNGLQASILGNSSLQIQQYPSIETSLNLWQFGRANAIIGSKPDDPKFYLTNDYYGGGLGDVTHSIVIDENGNVGIGTNQTSEEFQVAGTIKTKELIVERNDPNTGGMIFITNPAKGNTVGNKWGIYNMTGDTFGNSLQFWAYDNLAWNGGNCEHRLTLADNGNVGIGVVKPNVKLDVAAMNGDGIRIGKVGDAGNLAVPLTALSSQYNIDFTGYRNVEPDQVGARISALRFNIYQTNLAYVQSTGLAFYTNPTGINAGITDLVERMRISPDGKIGIGTDTPDSLLTVNGTIHAKQIVVDMNIGLADYVFDKSYRLMPLNKVEEYVNTNNHLPDVPSATEIKNKGMNMGEMQNKLLQKVEELTLYVIEQQKQIDQLKQELKK